MSKVWTQWTVYVFVDFCARIDGFCQLCTDRNRRESLWATAYTHTDSYCRWVCAVVARVDVVVVVVLVVLVVAAAAAAAANYDERWSKAY